MEECEFENVICKMVVLVNYEGIKVQFVDIRNLLFDYHY